MESPTLHICILNFDCSEMRHGLSALLMLDWWKMGFRPLMYKLSLHVESYVPFTGQKAESIVIIDSAKNAISVVIALTVVGMR